MLRKRRTAFTLVELLVVISIIGTLVALLLPAVQAARESARNVNCKNNLREIGQATLTFESGRRRFPGYRNLIQAGPTARVGGWVVEILPGLERQDVYDLWVDPSSAPPRIFLPILLCPSRGSPDSGRPDNTTVCSAGFFPGDFVGPNSSQWTFPAPYDNPDPASGYWRASQRSANGIFVDRVFNPQNTVRLSDVGDGVSNTLMFSENLSAAEWDDVTDIAEAVVAGTITPPQDLYLAKLGTTFVWLYTLESSGWSTAVDNQAGVPNFYLRDANEYAEAKINGLKDTIQSTRPSMSRPSSYHPGTVNVVFCDKRATSLNETIDYHVYQQLMTANGRRSDVPYRRYLLQDRDYTQ
jgi:prepilin-type N-terminal cleavage/methylation domain-containing protein